MIKRALATAMLFFLPFFAEPKPIKIEKKPSYSIAVKVEHASSPINWGNWGTSIDNLNKGLFISSEIPETVFHTLQIEKYLGNYSLGISFSQTFPQTFVGRSGVNIFMGDNLVAEVRTRSNMDFYEYNIISNIAHLFYSNRDACLGVGFSGGMFYKSATIDIGFTTMDICGDNKTLSSYSDVIAKYKGIGFKADIFAYTDWHLFKNMYFNFGASYCFLGKKKIKRTLYNIEQYNADSGLNEKREIDMAGSTRIIGGLKFKF